MSLQHLANKLKQRSCSQRRWFCLLWRSYSSRNVDFQRRQSREATGDRGGRKRSSSLTRVATNSFAANRQAYKSAVVNINTESVIKATSNPRSRRPRTNNNSDTEEDPREDLFRRFFGNPFDFENPQGVTSAFTASDRVCCGSKGYILTNFHVVEKADRIRVKMQDDATLYSAKLIGSDSETDLAVIKIDAKKSLPMPSSATPTPFK